MIPIFPLCIYLYVGIFQQHQHMKYYISKLIRYSRACGSCQDFIVKELLLNKGFIELSWSHHFERFTVAIMSLLTVTDYLCHRGPRIYSVCRSHNPVLHVLIMFYHRFLAKVIRGVPLVEQELLIMPERPRFYWGSCCLCLSWSFSHLAFGHCIVCPSIYSLSLITPLVSSNFSKINRQQYSEHC